MGAKTSSAAGGRGAARIAARVGAAVAAGWVFAFGFVSLGTVALQAAGLSYADAQMLCDLLAFVVWLAAICWAFAARGVLCVWGTLAGGGAAMTVAAWWLARASG